MKVRYSTLNNTSLVLTGTYVYFALSWNTSKSYTRPMLPNRRSPVAARLIVSHGDPPLAATTNTENDFISLDMLHLSPLNCLSKCTWQCQSLFHKQTMFTVTTTPYCFMIWLTLQLFYATHLQYLPGVTQTGCIAHKLDKLLMRTWMLGNFLIWKMNNSSIKLF